MILLKTKGRRWGGAEPQNKTSIDIHLTSANEITDELHQVKINLWIVAKVPK